MAGHARHLALLKPSNAGRSASSAVGSRRGSTLVPSSAVCLAAAHGRRESSMPVAGKSQRQRRPVVDSVDVHQVVAEQQQQRGAKPVDRHVWQYSSDVCDRPGAVRLGQQRRERALLRVGVCPRCVRRHDRSGGSSVSTARAHRACGHGHHAKWHTNSKQPRHRLWSTSFSGRCTSNVERASRTWLVWPPLITIITTMAPSSYRVPRFLFRTCPPLSALPRPTGARCTGSGCGSCCSAVRPATRPDSVYGSCARRG